MWTVRARRLAHALSVWPLTAIPGATAGVIATIGAAATVEPPPAGWQSFLCFLGLSSLPGLAGLPGLSALGAFSAAGPCPSGAGAATPLATMPNPKADARAATRTPLENHLMCFDMCGPPCPLAGPGGREPASIGRQ